MSLECFYTIPSSIENRRIIWRIDQQLLQHVNSLRQQIDPSAQLDEQTLEVVIARYLFEQLQQHPPDELCRRHWMAFLQRSCEKVANKIIWLLPAHLRFDCFSDLFIIGYQATIEPKKFLAKFDIRRSQIVYWYPTLKKFTDQKIKYLLLTQVRKITQIETLGRSNLALMARSSRKRVKEAIQNSDYGGLQLSHYLLVWQCFQEVKNASVAVNKMALEHFQLMAERYQQLQTGLGYEAGQQNVNGEQIKAWLEKIGSAIRQFLDTQTISLDAALEQGEENAILLQLTSKSSRDIDQLGEVENLIKSLIKEINTQQEQQYQILFLSYALELTQTKVAKELGFEQYQISRELRSLRKEIFGKAQEWIEENLHVQPSSEGLNEIESLLRSYCTETIDIFWQSATAKLPQMRIAPWEPLVYLCDRLTRKIEQHIELKLDKQGCAIAKIPLLVEQRLNESGMHSLSQHLD